MTICIEFYGIPRQRTQVATSEFDAAGPVRLQDILQHLAIAYPAFARDCLVGDHLAPGCLANIDGTSFVSDPAASIPDGTCLLILSSDAGG